MAYKLDPEVAAAVMPMFEMQAQHPPPAVHDVKSRRVAFGLLVQMLKDMPSTPDVIKKDYHTTTSDGHSLLVTWFSMPTIAASKTPTAAILHIHGGGMIMGSVSDLHNPLSAYVAASGVPILSVEYRLAPEHPHPAPTEDSYAGLTWLHEHTKELNVDPTRIAVLGESAGGGIAAGVALMARDRKLSPPLAYQILIYPMLDDRNTAVDEKLKPFLVWNNEDSITGWSALLGKDVIGTEHVSPYAAPARTESVEGLPPTYIDVGELDYFRAEDLEYARRIAAAGIPIEFHLIKGVPHAFELLAPKSAVAQRTTADRLRVMASF